MRLVEIGTKEWRNRHQGNIEWRGDDRTVSKAIGLKCATRADWLYHTKINDEPVLNDIQRNAAIQIMTLYVLSGSIMRGVDYSKQGGKGIERDPEQQDHYDILVAIGRRLGAGLWATLQREIIAELREHQEGYKQNIPAPYTIERLREALDRIDAYLYEFRRDDIPAAFF